MRSYSLDFTKTFFDHVVRLAEKNDMSLSQFVEIILTHHFHHGGTIAYILDEEIKLMPSPNIEHTSEVTYLEFKK